MEFHACGFMHLCGVSYCEVTIIDLHAQESKLEGSRLMRAHDNVIAIQQISEQCLQQLQQCAALVAKTTANDNSFI